MKMVVLILVTMIIALVMMLMKMIWSGGDDGRKECVFVIISCDACGLSPAADCTGIAGWYVYVMFVDHILQPIVFHCAPQESRNITGILQQSQESRNTRLFKLLIQQGKDGLAHSVHTSYPCCLIRVRP
jgi:hypothetical protein